MARFLQTHSVMDETASGIAPEQERRATKCDRRSGIDRRGGPRNGQDRRKGDRRAAASVALGIALMGVSVTPVSADIFTRRNDRGVLEATDRPAAGDGYKLAYKSKGIVIHSASFHPSSANALRFEPFVLEAAAREGVSADLVRAVIHTESAFDPLAISSTGARGLMQLMPDAARRFGVQNALDPRDNILGGVRYLRVLLKMFQGDVALTVAAYNAGEGAVTRHGGIPPYRETRDYVRKILGLLSQGPARPTVMMASYTPKAARVEPRILYKWRSADGVHHIAQTPPAGVEYVTLRLTD
jgi:transglycosylase-like protein with SLT domain